MSDVEVINNSGGANSGVNVDNACANVIQGEGVEQMHDPQNSNFNQPAQIVNEGENIGGMCYQNAVEIPNAWMNLGVCTHLDKIKTGDSILDEGIEKGVSERVYTGQINTKQKHSNARQALSKSYVYYKISARGILPRSIEFGTQSGMSCECLLTTKMNEMLQKALTSKPYDMVTRKLRFDLCAILARACSCLGLYSLCGMVTEKDLTGGKRGTVSAAGIDGVIEYREGGIFIPKFTTQTSAYTSSVLTRLAWGCNAIVSAVDVRVAGDANLVVLHEHREQDTISSLYEIIDYIMNMYAECGRGNEAILAMVCGYHSVMTVKAHTMEGGIVRDVLREIEFAIPHGVIIPMVSVGGALCMPRAPTGTRNWLNYVSQIDSFVLSTAALVGVSDPGCLVNGYSAPTVMQASSHVNDMNSDEWRKQIRHKQHSSLVELCESFCDLYIENLGRMTGCDNSENRWRAKNILVGAFEENSIINSRHLEYQTMCPWYWVESTTIFSNVRWARGPSFDGGWGLFCERDVGVLPCLDGAKVKEISPNGVRYIMPQGSLRRHSYIQHISKSKKDGLVFMRASYVDIHGILMRGQTRQSEAVEHSDTNSMCFDENSSYTTRIDKLVWGKRDNDLISPGECIFTHPWYLDIRTDAWNKISDKSDHVLDGMPEFLYDGIEAWSSMPILDNRRDLPKREWPEIKRRCVDIDAVSIAKEGYDTTICSNFDGRYVVGKYKEGALKDRISDGAKLRARLLNESLTVSNSLPSRVETILAPVRSMYPKNYIDPRNRSEERTMAGSRPPIPASAIDAIQGSNFSNIGMNDRN